MDAIFTVDLIALLDKSRIGADAAKALEKAWGEAHAHSDAKRKELLEQLQGKRDALRQKLIDRARPIIAELGKVKGALAVLEKGSVAWTSGGDLTDEVMAKLDASGPL
jgi:Skp family chaperone for outer membrane proteins